MYTKPNNHSNTLLAIAFMALVITGCRTDNPWLEPQTTKTSLGETSTASQSSLGSYAPDVVSSVMKPFIFQGKFFADHIGGNQKSEVALLKTQLERRNNPKATLQEVAATVNEQPKGKANLGAFRVIRSYTLESH